MRSIGRSCDYQWRRRSAVVSTWIVISFGAFAAARGALPLELTWDAPPECPSGNDVVQAVMRLVRHPPAEPRSAVVRITRREADWGAELRSSGGVRLLSGETCTGLSETVVVILALSIDPGADTTTASFPVEEPPAAEGSRAPAVVAAEERHEARAPRASDDVPAELPRDAAAPDRPALQLGGVLRVFGELGLMPGPAFGGAVAVRAQRGALSGEASAAALLPQTGTLADEDTRGGRFSWFAGQIVGCLSSTSDVTLAGCVGGEIGRLSGTGTGVDVQETRRAAWFGPLLSVRAGLPLAHHAIFETELALVLPLSRPTFALEQFGDVHTPAVVSGRVGAGIRWP